LIRAVLDTNVVISALVFEGPANALVPAWQQPRFVWLVSKPLVAEYIRVLHYPKFRLSRDEIRHLVERELLPFVTPITVRRVPRVITADPADNHVLACASAGKADLIVSGDRHLLDLARYCGIPVLPLSMFLHRLGPAR
jgi:putative PIN family toxin of toxin-antitoxin system